MAGENIVVYNDAARKTLEATGAAIVNGAIGQAVTAIYDIIVDGGGYPHADFALVGTFGVAPLENSVLALYARPLDIDGLLDTAIPEAVRPTYYVGAFVVDNVIVSQAMLLTAFDLPRKAEYYVHNVATGQSLNAGWTLKVTPRTNKAAV